MVSRSNSAIHHFEEIKLLVIIQINIFELLLDFVFYS
jgi:hypothetical protein